MVPGRAAWTARPASLVCYVCYGPWCLSCCTARLGRTDTTATTGHCAPARWQQSGRRMRLAASVLRLQTRARHASFSSPHAAACRPPSSACTRVVPLRWKAVGGGWPLDTCLGSLTGTTTSLALHRWSRPSPRSTERADCSLGIAAFPFDRLALPKAQAFWWVFSGWQWQVRELGLQSHIHVLPHGIILLRSLALSRCTLVDLDTLLLTARWSSVWGWPLVTVYFFQEFRSTPTEFNAL